MKPSPQKMPVDEFIYFGSNILSTKIGVNIRIEMKAYLMKLTRNSSSFCRVSTIVW